VSVADRVLAVARAQIGYVEQGGPHGNDGNQTKFWDWWDSITGEHDQGASWCGAFVSWCFDQADARLDQADSHHGPGFIYCPGAEAHYRSTHRVVNAPHANPGDIVLFHFQGEANEANHTGILESFDLHNVTCIEGNTSSGSAGSQSNGGGVYRRTRPWSQVRAVCHPPQLDDDTPPQEDSGMRFPDHGALPVTIGADGTNGPNGTLIPSIPFDKVTSVIVKANDNGTAAEATVQPFAGFGGILALRVTGKPGNVGIIVGYRP
jgi:hypothetical protein